MPFLIQMLTNILPKMPKSKNVKFDTKIKKRIIFRYYFDSISTFRYTSNRMFSKKKKWKLPGYQVTRSANKCLDLKEWLHNQLPNLRCWHHGDFIIGGVFLRAGRPKSCRESEPFSSDWAKTCGYRVGTLRVPGRNLRKKITKSRELRIEVYRNVLIYAK